jgi:hypothetical protein
MMMMIIQSVVDTHMWKQVCCYTEVVGRYNVLDIAAESSSRFHQLQSLQGEYSCVIRRFARKHEET